MEWNLKEAMEYYASQGAPGEQGALVALLREVQRERGGIPAEVPGEIAKAYGVKEGLILALIKRIPSLNLKESRCLELCAGPNCRGGALGAYVEKRYPGVTVKYVPCMRLCGKGPNLRWKGQLYHGADKELIDSLMK
ncbi:MAG: formate dehydrogenase [Candidatus Faecousia sp.]|nr:formate dehydrogenase [Clostridiales bacterium]MDY6179230.1 formate dehydrogenase [Candidatus Faecousia sp.]